jgi:ATP-dependent Clp protease ATP-binding subunit ClpC
MNIIFLDGVVERIVAEGYDSFFGARPLRRTITKLIEDAFAREMLLGRFSHGDNIEVTVSDGEIVFSVKNNDDGI